MQIIENRALQIRTRHPNKYKIIPKHYIEPIEGGYLVTVHWGLDECRVLCNLGVKDVPSPIRKSYKWPGKYKPMAHQRATAEFVTLHRRCFVLSEAGTAKTLSVLWAADYLMQIKVVRRCLVICPLSIMHSAWMGDLNRSIIHRSAVVCHHTNAERRRELIRGDYEFVIINYDGLPLVADAIQRDGRFDLIIVDEASGYSTSTTKRWKCLHKLLTPSTWLWMMTGTPAAQSPLQAYGLAKMVNPYAVPQFFTAWRDMVMHKVTMFKWLPKPDAKAKVFEALQPSIRFTKDQCLDLPPVLTEVREVPMTPQQQKYYDIIRNDMLARAAGVQITAVNKAALVSKLLQVSQGCALSDDKEVVEFDASKRLSVLTEVLEETNRKILIFALFRASIDLIHRHLVAKGYDVDVIHGGVASGQRGNIVNRFQFTDSPRILVMQPQATAHGLTLTQADTVVFYGPLMSVEQYIQCVARADRQGQVADKVTVIHLQSSPIERKMFSALENKVSDHAILAKMFDEEVKGR